MARSIRTAVAAIAAEHARRQAISALSSAGIELLAMERNARDALRSLADHRPDLLLADMELPEMEGSRLVLKTLSGYNLPVRPAAVLMYYPEFPLPDDQALASYGVALVEKPVTAAGFKIAIRTLESENPVFSPAEKQRADALLNTLGVPAHRGRECLRAALLICAADERCRHDLGGRLYPRVGEICSLSATQVERSIRHAIDLAWRSDKFDNQYRIFADTVDAGRGQPTCGEMISRLADILRLEG